MDIVNKRRVKGGNGNMAAEYSDVIARAQSWAVGADAATQDIEAESHEQDMAFSVQHPSRVNFETDENIKRGGRTDGVK